jgi:hypothetical protein
MGFSHELPADLAQLVLALIGGRRIGHAQAVQGVEEDLGYDQPCRFLVIGRNDVPGSLLSAGLGQTRLMGGHVVLPGRPGYPRLPID